MVRCPVLANYCDDLNEDPESLRQVSRRSPPRPFFLPEGRLEAAIKVREIGKAPHSGQWDLLWRSQGIKILFFLSPPTAEELR